MKLPEIFFSNAAAATISLVAIFRGVASRKRFIMTRVSSRTASNREAGAASLNDS